MNWGRVLLLIILLFCIFLIYSINKINHQVRTDFVLTECGGNLENCEHKYIAMQKAKKDHSFRVAKADPFIVIELPKTEADEYITGEILFYCPYNAEFDKRVQVVVDSRGQQLVPRSWLQGKAYIVKIGWRDHGECHYDEKYILLN